MTQTKTTFSVLEMALHYASAWGWAVFPLHSVGDDGNCTCNKKDCQSPGKHPVASLVPNGVLNASKDEKQIKAWFGDLGAPWANVGIATGKISNLVVVDVDEAKGAMGHDLTKPYLHITPDDFDTPQVKTGGGVHIYYSLPKYTEIKNSASKLGAFIDVRGEGGYVVAPPSKHISGRVYEFLNNVEKLLEFPAEWLKKLNQSSSASQPPVNGNGSASPPNQNGQSSGGLFVPPPISNLIVPDAIKQGTRNQTLTQIGGSLRRIGLSENAIYSALFAENKRICQPPLDDKEVAQIAHSVARYKPADDLNAVSDADNPADYENTLKPYLFGEFLDMEFEEKEILGFHIGKRDIAIIQAATNAGKTTLLRNVGLCMAAGREFQPFYEGTRPVKIAYFDFENDAQDVQRDLRLMYDVFSDREKKFLKENLIIIPKGLKDGELFQFNTHEAWANALIQQNGVEFIIVDNVSAAYDLNDENSNAEVTRKVIKPLLKMAYKGNCAFLFAHHYGKSKNELEHAGVHAGRGASALQALSRTVINMFGDVSKGETVTVECAKRKTDGGQNYTQVFRLEDDRWFHHTMIVPPPKKKTAYQTLREFFDAVIYPAMVSTADVIAQFETEFGIDSIKKALNELYKDGFLEKPKHGFYCGKDLKQGAPQSVKVDSNPKSFYEKDDDTDDDSGG